MITFGYKSKARGWIMSVLTILIGVVMILAKDQAMNAVVKIIADFIITSGVVYFAVGYKNRGNGAFPLMIVNAVADIAIGVVMFVFNSFFASLFIYIVGLVLLLFGLFQIVALFSANRVLRVGWFSFVFPCLVCFAGAFLLFNPVFAKAWISILAGVALCIYGVSELITTWKMKHVIEFEEAGMRDEYNVDNQ